MRGHVVSRGPINPKTDEHAGAPWLVVVELGLQPAQRCAACVNPKGAHRLFWLDGRPLPACPRCGGELEDVKARKQFTRDGIATKREAEALLKEQLGEREAGTYVEPNLLTVAEFLTKRWLPDTKNGRKPSTHASYEHHVKAYIVPALGTLLLRHLDAGHINSMYTDLAAPGGGQRHKGLSPATQRRIHHTLRAALRDALGWKLVAYNAAAVANPPALDSGPEATMQQAWTRAQLGSFLDHVAEDRLFALWRVFATTGMRRGEVCGLQWKHIDFKRSTIRVRQAAVVVGSKVVLGTPKTKAGRRDVSIGRGTLEALVTWYVAQAEELRMLEASQTPETFVFTDKKGEPLHPESVTTSFNRSQLALRAEILKRHTEGDAQLLPHIRLHDLRHTHGTHLAADHVPPKDAAQRLGHDVITYMQTYVHTDPAISQIEAEEFEARLDAD
jgi:integrase